MALPIPKLDDKTFEEIVREATGLIPRFAREWTDHNISDPGISFIELFAWLAEMQIYQLDRITDHHKKIFLKLVNISPSPLQPARTDIHFRLKADTQGVLIQAGTKLAPVGMEDVVFETVEDSFLTRSSLESVITHLDAFIVDNSEANKNGNVSFYPFGEEASQGASLHLQFDQLFAEKEFCLTFVGAEDSSSPGANHGPGPLPEMRSVELVWEFRHDEEWFGLTVKKDTTRKLMESGRIVCRTPPPTSNVNGHDSFWIRCRLEKGTYEIPPRINQIVLNTIPVVQVETVIEERLGKSDGSPDQTFTLQKPPVFEERVLDASPLYVGDILDWQSFAKKLLTDPWAPVERFRQLLDPQSLKMLSDDTLPTKADLQYAVIGGLNRLHDSPELYQGDAFKEVGLPKEYQMLIERLPKNISEAELRRLNRFLFHSAFANEIVGITLALQVENLDGTREDWTRVDAFQNSGPEDRHYTLEPKEGKITFGNGLNGRVPQPEEQIRARFYKTSMGPGGNLPPGRHWRFLEPRLRGFVGKNQEPASGGSAEEPLEHAELRARKDFNTTYRAITSEDFEQLARSTPGVKVARAKAIPNYDPGYPCVTVPGAVTVVVVPGAREQQVTRGPSEGFLQTVKEYLTAHRLVATVLHVVAPEYVKVSVQGQLRANGGYSYAKLQARVAEALESFLHPLTGGPDGKGWSFGRPVYPSEVYQVIDKVEGVDYAGKVSLSCQGPCTEEDGILRISPTGLVVSGIHHFDEI